MATPLDFGISQGYQRAIRFGAYWTIAVGPYLLLSVIGIFALGGLPVVSGDIVATLEMAGRSPLTIGAIFMLDAIFHPLYLVTAVALYAILRWRWPVRASLILVCGAWQMVVGLTKGLSSLLTLTLLGAAYVSGDATLRTALMPVAASQYGLRLAFQSMDSFGVMAIWIILSLFPAESGIPRAVRWLGWLLTLALLSATPSGMTFMIVALVFPVWLFLVARWMLQQVPTK